MAHYNIILASGSGQEFRGLRPTEWKERKGKILEFVNEESPDPMAE